MTTDTPRVAAYWQDRQDEISEIIERHGMKSAYAQFRDSAKIVSDHNGQHLEMVPTPLPQHIPTTA